MVSAAVKDSALARRATQAGKSGAQVEWFIEQLMKRVDVTLEQRMMVAVQFLANTIVQNINVPVVKEVIGGRTRVTERSKPGEFPRVDTAMLRNTVAVMHGVKSEGGRVYGWVGTPLDYGVILELHLDRRFLTRTLEEELESLKRIILEPIT